MIRLLLVAACMSCLWTSMAFAQPKIGITSELERTATTTAQEKMEYATAALNEMRIAAKAIGRMVDVARKDSSVEEVICLSTRLTSIRALLQVSEGADRALRDALALKDNNKGNHEFRKIAVALTKTRQLVSESERCASDNVLRSGETSIKWQGGLESPEDDTADLETDLLDLGIDPPEVSPFL